MVKNKICKQEECTGCMACYNICPQKCIEMKYDKYGELNPVIDEERCINCNLCRKVCPNNAEIKYNQPLQAYATWSKEEKDRQTSTSGGIASVFYQNAIENGYVVFGTSFDEDLKLKHSYAATKEGLNKYKGSKYCQSNIEESYKNIKEFIKNNKKVLFIGTPCQISGLNNYIKKLNINKENLITIDLVCHGVPSQEYLSEYVKYLEEKKGKKANKITFRDSDKYIFKLNNNNEKIYSKVREKDLYLTAFQLSILQRECCLNCKYATKYRVSDITIGDFWGIKENNKITKQEEKKGISLVLLNSEKGRILFDNCQDKIFYENREIKEAVDGNAHLRRPSKSNEYRKKFREIYTNGNFINCIKEVLKKEMKLQSKKYIIVQIKQKIKNIIKR